MASAVPIQIKTARGLVSVRETRARCICTIKSSSLMSTNSKYDNISVKVKDSVKQRNVTMLGKWCLDWCTYSKQGPEYHKSWNKLEALMLV